jgi:hypothetical protein
LTADSEPVSVLYIAGSGRCGSTILGALLERGEGVFSPGELMHLWERGVRGGHPCGCGEPVPACEVWSEILADVAGESLQARAAAMMQAQHQVARTVHLPLLLTGRGRERLGAPLQAYVGHLDALYRSIRDRTGARLVVDASKAPAYAAVLRLVPSIDLTVVHLVRDPRAVAYSWGRRRELVPTSSGAPLYMHQAGPTESTSLWLRYNGGTGLVRRALPTHRSLRLRYEDFVTAPAASLRTIAALLSLPADTFGLEDGHAVLGENHSVSGNPSRFRSGAVELRADDQWRADMRAADRRRVMALAWPLAWRYGYR